MKEIKKILKFYEFCKTGSLLTKYLIGKYLKSLTLLSVVFYWTVFK